VAGRIAVTVDGTPASDAALQRAVEMAREDGGILTGVFVIDSGWADFIGNDWQSSRNARQGFLDYMLQEQEQQAEAARRQFDAATLEVAGAHFVLLAGDPADTLVRMMAIGSTDVLVTGKHVFQACGRPSVKTLAKTLSRKVRQPVLVL
jgi:nucleotide-binding universal stress UspA family protein